jgi:beta-xylosidase
MKNLRRLACLLCALVLLSALPPSVTANSRAAGPPTPNPDTPFGIAGVMRWPDWGTFGKPADVFRQTGATWVREDFAWGLIQPAPDRWDWTATDRIVGNLFDRKINILGILSYSASWATATKADDGSTLSMYPPDLNTYYHYVRTIVSRYKHAVHHWEVWNEPDNNLFWKPAPNPKEYAALLKMAYKAIKEVDPSAQVLAGGVSGNAVPFLDEVMAAGGRDAFDVLAIHPYAVPLDQANARQESRPEVHKILEVELTKYRAFLQRHGLARPIWITEIGWPSRDWGLDAGAQADYLAQAYGLLLSSGLVDKVFWYSFKDQGAQPGDTWGLIGWGAGATDLAPRRPAFNAYATAANLLGETTPGGRLQLGEYSVALPFEETGVWARSTHQQGLMSVSGEVKHSGSGSGKMQYAFDGANQAVDFAPPAPVALQGNPTRIGLWVLGDGSGNYLSAWLRDRDGELFKVRLGSVSGASDGWRYYESRINNYYFDWERALGNPANGKPDAPLSFVSFRLENTPDLPAAHGTIFVDDLQTWGGPDVTALRFNRRDGSVVDMLWSEHGANFALPTASEHAQVFTRDGAESTAAAKDAAFALKVTDSPTYVIHKPGKASRAAGTAPALGAPEGSAAICLATARVADQGGVANRFFPETGHNVWGSFLDYWQRNGGVRVIGYPLTEVFEAQLADGKPYKQQ